MFISNLYPPLLPKLYIETRKGASLLEQSNVDLERRYYNSIEGIYLDLEYNLII